jgi:hypothetical protein
MDSSSAVLGGRANLRKPMHTTANTIANAVAQKDIGKLFAWLPPRVISVNGPIIAAAINHRSAFFRKNPPEEARLRLSKTFLVDIGSSKSRHLLNFVVMNQKG